MSCAPVTVSDSTWRTKNQCRASPAATSAPKSFFLEVNGLWSHEPTFSQAVQGQFDEGKEDPEKFAIINRNYALRSTLAVRKFTHRYDPDTQTETLKNSQLTLTLNPIRENEIKAVQELFKRGKQAFSNGTPRQITHRGTLLNQTTKKTVEVFVELPTPFTGSDLYSVKTRTYSNGEKRLAIPYPLYTAD